MGFTLNGGEVYHRSVALTLRAGDTAQLSVQTEAHYDVYLPTLWTSSGKDTAAVGENTGLDHAG